MKNRLEKEKKGNEAERFAEELTLCLCDYFIGDFRRQGTVIKYFLKNGRSFTITIQ